MATDSARTEAGPPPRFLRGKKDQNRDSLCARDVELEEVLAVAVLLRLGGMENGNGGVEGGGKTIPCAPEVARRPRQMNARSRPKPILRTHQKICPVAYTCLVYIQSTDLYNLHARIDASSAANRAL